VAAPNKRSGFSMSRLSLLSDLAGALDNEQLILHYQPKIDIVTGQLVGVEALVRWIHPRFGLLAPDAFVPLAEQTELMAPFTEYVLGEALRQCATWAAAGFDIPVAVNGSARNLHDVRFPQEVARLLRQAAVDPSLLEVEITENTVMANPVTAASVLAGLRDVGVRLSVDDFGTGYSSLTALRDLPVDRIKIDKSFVSSITVQNGDAVIVRSIVELARNLGLETIAEGVEDTATLDLLATMGCTTAQGFLIARPSPVEVITPWIREHADRLALPPALSRRVILDRPSAHVATR
jgi:EAL domain-containing protein (putative c-di-GMP-specific phosphodiesterase class I)